MRLDFNILWVEDQPANVSDQQEKIQNLIRKEGFKLQAKFAASVDEATEYLSDGIFGDHIDLILMDYDLGSGKNGDEGLKEVRKIFPFKDLVFYSARSTVDLMKLVRDANIQGVFIAYRLDLPDVVEGVFENLVRKVLDIDHSRGIVMGATSEIDYIISQNIEKLFDQCSQSQRDLFISAIHKRIDEKSKDFIEKINNLRKIKHVKELLEYHSVYTSDDMLRLLVKLMKQLSLHRERYTAFEAYRNNVMPMRNDLAHVKVEKNGFSRRLIGRKGEFTETNMRNLRANLLEFQEILDELFH